MKRAPWTPNFHFLAKSLSRRPAILKQHSHVTQLFAVDGYLLLAIWTRTLCPVGPAHNVALFTIAYLELQYDSVYPLSPHDPQGLTVLVQGQ